MLLIVGTTLRERTGLEGRAVWFLWVARRNTNGLHSLATIRYSIFSGEISWLAKRLLTNLFAEAQL